MELLTPADACAVINYFQICPESTDGRLLAYTLFPGGPAPGNVGDAEVWVRDLATGRAWRVGPAARVGHHRGACPTWLDDRRLAWNDGDHLCLAELFTATPARRWPGQVDTWAPALKRLLWCQHDEHGGDSLRALNPDDGRVTEIIGFNRLATLGALDGVAPAPAHWRLHHAYASPGGQWLAAAIFVPAPSEAQIFLIRPDGGELRLFGPKPMHWVFADEASFMGQDDKREQRDKHLRRWDFSGRVVEHLAGPGCHSAVSPAGQWIVSDGWYTSDPVDFHLYRRGETLPRRRFASMRPLWSWRLHGHPAFSRDGRTVYANFHAPGARATQVARWSLDELLAMPEDTPPPT